MKILPFAKIISYFRRGDALVVNTTKVFKARLFGHRTTGGKVEIFLIKPVEGYGGGSERWEAFVSPSRRVKEGEEIVFEPYRVLLRRDMGGGKWEVEFKSASQCRKIIQSHGHVPLPHYIKRQDIPSDLRRYQTVFADKEKVGAVAAPTAGFHFTKALLKEIAALGVNIIELCLHVGPGTFKPVSVQNIHEHTVDPEYAELSPKAAKRLNKARTAGGRIFAVGTTSVRTLESAPIVDGAIQPFAGMVDLYIKPGFTFKVIDHLITNFHLPKSSLLILVSAFAGRERILRAYEYAIEQRLRFYSYGDAMLIL